MRTVSTKNHTVSTQKCTVSTGIVKKARHHPKVGSCQAFLFLYIRIIAIELSINTVHLPLIRPTKRYK
jgi:hypothetical protein